MDLHVVTRLKTPIKKQRKDGTFTAPSSEVGADSTLNFPTKIIRLKSDCFRFVDVAFTVLLLVKRNHVLRVYSLVEVMNTDQDTRKVLAGNSSLLFSIDLFWDNRNELEATE